MTGDGVAGAIATAPTGTGRDVAVMASRPMSFQPRSSAEVLEAAPFGRIAGFACPLRASIVAVSDA